MPDGDILGQKQATATFGSQAVCHSHSRKCERPGTNRVTYHHLQHALSTIDAEEKEVTGPRKHVRLRKRTGKLETTFYVSTRR